MATHPMSESRRQDLAAWLTANGINPSDVPSDSNIQILDDGNGNQTIRYVAIARDERGRARSDKGWRVLEMRETRLLVAQKPLAPGDTDPCTATIEGPHIPGGGPVQCAREAGHPENHVGPTQDGDGRTLWSDHHAGATPHQASAEGER